MSKDQEKLDFIFELPGPPTSGRPLFPVKYLHPRGPELVGYLPTFLSEGDPRPAREQLHEAYAHAGGWRPFQGFTRDENNMLHYPGDPSFSPVALMVLRDEQIFVYPYAWVMILQQDGSYEIARMD